MPAAEDRQRGIVIVTRVTRLSRARLAVLVAGLLAVLVLGTGLVTPLLAAADLPGAGPIYLAFAPLCHQDAARSLALGGAQLPVCARCSGLYLGGAIGLLLGLGLLGRFPRLHASLLLLAAPSAIDAFLPWVGLSGLGNVPRLLISVPAGCVAGLFLAVGIADLFRPRGVRQRRTAVLKRPLEVTDG